MQTGPCPEQVLHHGVWLVGLAAQGVWSLGCVVTRVCSHWGVQRDHITFAGASPPHAHSCPTCALRPLHWCWWPVWEVRGAGGRHPVTYSSRGPGPTGRGGWLQLQPRLPGVPTPMCPCPGVPKDVPILAVCQRRAEI